MAMMRISDDARLLRWTVSWFAPGPVMVRLSSIAGNAPFVSSSVMVCGAVAGSKACPAAVSKVIVSLLGIALVSSRAARKVHLHLQSAHSPSPILLSGVLAVSLTVRESDALTTNGLVF